MSTFYLPYGDVLKVLLVNPSIPKNSLKSLLRQRGVFIGGDDRDKMVAFLVRTGISSSELNFLLERKRTKEDNPKVRTQSIPCNSSPDIFLIEALADNFDLRQIIRADNPFSNFSIEENPSFTPIEDRNDKIELNFKIKRRDLSKSWMNKDEEFHGKTVIEYDEGSQNIRFIHTHTVPETKAICDKVARFALNKLRDHDLIEKEAVINRVRFNDFTNENRIEFLNRLLLQKRSKSLRFLDVMQLSFRPALDITLPESISWMERRVSTLEMKGEKFHQTDFLKNRSLWPFIEVYSLSASMGFDYPDFSGECTVVADFPDFQEKERSDAELVLSVDKILLTDDPVRQRLSTAKEKILRALDGDKLQFHKELSGVNT